MRDFTDPLAATRRRIEDARGYLQVDLKRDRVAELANLASAPDLWDDPDRARQLTTELARVEDDVQLVDGLSQRLGDAEAAVEHQQRGAAGSEEVGAVDADVPAQRRQGLDERHQLPVEAPGIDGVRALPPPPCERHHGTAHAACPSASGR